MRKLKQSSFIIFLFFVSLNNSFSQPITQKLIQANVLAFHQKVMVYGYEQQKNNLVFKCYSFNYQLKLKDSIVFNVGKHTPIDYLETTVDTLHDVINFYFQLANEKNVVTLLRLNDTLGKICSAENYDANHINSIAVFDNEKYIYKHDMFVIRTNKDSGGVQFYLNKFHLKSILKPFEYEDKWQFAFERQYIHRASVIFADSNIVLIYAHVNDGAKRGQWILRLNAKTGLLVKGTRISNKSDTKNYLVSNWHYDLKQKSLSVIGSIYENEMVDFKKGTSNFINLSKRHQLFLICMDSTGEIITKTEKLLALPVQTNKINFTSSYHLKIRDFQKSADNNFDVWADVYEQSFPNTFVYYSSWHLDILPNDIDYEITPSKFMIATNAIPKFINYTKGDMYGKFILDNITDYDKFKYKKQLNTVIEKIFMDDNNNSNFILKKTDILLGTKTFNYVFVGKKGLEYKVLLNVAKNQKANLFFIKNFAYLSFITNTDNTVFELKRNDL